MLEALKNIFSKTKAFNEGVQTGITQGIAQESRRRMEDSEKSRLFQIESLVGHLVIIVSNEFENICVGHADRVAFITKAQNPVLEYTNIVTGEVGLALGITFLYTEQKFNALNTIDKNALTAILYFRESDYTVHKTFETDTVVDSMEWDRRVKEAIVKFQAKKPS